MNIILIITGLVICLLAHPRVRLPLMARLYNEGLVTPRQVKPEKAELVKFAGADLSLLILGIALIFIGLVI